MVCSNCDFSKNRATAQYCARCGHALTGEPVVPLLGRVPAGAVLQDRYEIQDVLGEGGMGAVYLAVDHHNFGQRRALKELVVNHTMAGFEDALAMFQREATILRRLHHPNLPHVFGTFSENGREYLVMEYIEGETLDDKIRNTPRGFPVQQVLGWAEQLCDTLHYLHSQNPPIVFRDVKPGNIMLTPAGTIKLIDFGIARFFKLGQTHDTLELGTAGFAPPEQHGRSQTDPRSDVYALGVTLHYLLTGRDPATQPFIFPRLPDHFPPELQPALDKALEMEADDRYQVMPAFKADLFRAKSPSRALPIESTQKSAPTRTSEPNPRTPAVQSPPPSRPSARQKQKPRPHTPPTTRPGTTRTIGDWFAIGLILVILLGVFFFLISVFFV